MDKIKELYNKIVTALKKLYNRYSDVILPTVVLLAICIVVTLALSSTNLLTRGPIAKIAAENNQKAMQKVLEAESYTQQTLTLDGVDYTYNIAANGEEIVGYIFISAAKGYGGNVSVMTAINPDGSVKAVEILDVSNETPGLGQNATKPAFYEQFIGKSGETSVVKNGALAEKGEVDAITGATITSKAVSHAVNEALRLTQNIISTEGGGEQ